MLKITKSGKLKEKYWDSSVGKYRTRDLTKTAIKQLFEVCELEKGCTLKSIFKLLQSNLDAFDAVLGNWTKETVTEGLKAKPGPYKKGPEDIEYLELCYNPLQTRWKKYGDSLSGLTRLDFHGLGFVRKKDKYFDWTNKDGSKTIEQAKGTRTPWSTAYSAPNTLINIPIVLNNKFNIYEENIDTKISATNLGWKQLLVLDNPEYTLGQILYSIVWELSWNGPPVKRDKKLQELKDMVKDIKKNGTKAYKPYKSK